MYTIARNGHGWVVVDSKGNQVTGSISRKSDAQAVADKANERAQS